jgi:uncharacterized protein (DUF2252 family)
MSCPLSSHGDVVVSSLRPDPLTLLGRQDAERLPELLPLRYERLAHSPFTFLQGAAAVMADDLAGTPSTCIMVQLCGDAHVGNFGLYRTPAGRLVFDIRDFDETHEGPWEWDVKRLLASLAVAGRQNGYSASQRRSVLLRAGREYRTAVRRFATMSNLEMWFAQADVDTLHRHHPFARTADLRRSKARRPVTEVVDGEHRLVPDPPALVPAADLLTGPALADLEDRVGGLFEDYRATLTGEGTFLLDHFRVVQIARAAGSAGATGTRTWIVLLVGRDTREPLLLQIRQAHPSVLYPLSSVETSSDHAQRVVTGQRLVQAAGDVFLGWQRLYEGPGQRRDYYVREVRDWLPSPAIDAMAPHAMGAYGELCAWTLARAHARSGDRIALAAYLGEDAVFEETTAEFAEAYADLNLADYQRLRGDGGAA